MDSNNGFRTKPIQQQHEHFMRQVMDIILKDAVFEGTSSSSLVVEWIEPECLMALMGEELPKNPQSDQHLIELIKNVVRYSVKTGHPHFINQLFSRYSLFEIQNIELCRSGHLDVTNSYPVTSSKDLVFS